MRDNFIILIAVWPILLLPALVGCRGEEEKIVPVPAQETAQAPPVKPRLPGCKGCHGAVQLDDNHNFVCTDCHLGNNDTSDKELAHKGFIADPANPVNMAVTCGKCHADQIESCSQSLHFTVQKPVNLVRSHFGIEPPLADLTEIPENGRPQNKAQLVDDMLRRRCLRCHVYTAGDSYPYVQRGTGCAACHLQFTDSKLESHSFILPKERQCLSCHYGNHVGADFLGMYEHDYNWEYRTPYTTRQPFMRPYGVELHQLVSDIHQQRGLTCLDCHNKGEMSGRQNPIRCEDCHSPAHDTVPILTNVRVEADQLILQGRIDGKDHPIPPLTHPAHAKYNDRVACQVCHAQWAFNDRPTHLLLSYTDDVDPWDRLTVQSSSHVETFLEHNLYSMEDELDTTMPDSISGQNKAGIWYMGYGMRRWEDILIRRDVDGIIKVFRPILDLRLSAVDEDDERIFDNLKGNSDGLLPYTPHTTGPAGMFYERRFFHLLEATAAEAVQESRETGR